MEVRIPGVDGLFVADRVRTLAKHFRTSTAVVCQICLSHSTGFYNIKNSNLSEAKKQRLLAAFPGLDLAWLLNGIGDFHPENITPQADLLGLISGKNDMFKKVMEKESNTDMALQYISDHGLDVNSFVKKYGLVYPALRHSYRVIASGETNMPISVQTIEQLQKQIAELKAIIAVKDLRIEKLTDALIRAHVDTN